MWPYVDVSKLARGVFVPLCFQSRWPHAFRASEDGSGTQCVRAFWQLAAVFHSTCCSAVCFGVVSLAKACWVCVFCMAGMMLMFAGCRVTPLCTAVVACLRKQRVPASAVPALAAGVLFEMAALFAVEAVASLFMS